MWVVKWVVNTANFIRANREGASQLEQISNCLRSAQTTCITHLHNKKVKEVLTKGGFRPF